MGLKSQSEAFRTFVLAQTAFTSVLNEELYPYGATEGKTFPIAVYRVQQTPATYDGDQYDIALFLWFENDYDACTELVDAMTAVFKESGAYDWKLSDVDYDPETKIFNGIINITTIT